MLSLDPHGNLCELVFALWEVADQLIQPFSGRIDVSREICYCPQTFRFVIWYCASLTYASWLELLHGSLAYEFFVHRVVP